MKISRNLGNARKQNTEGEGGANSMTYKMFNF